MGAALELRTFFEQRHNIARTHDYMSGTSQERAILGPALTEGLASRHGMHNCSCCSRHLSTKAFSWPCEGSPCKMPVQFTSGSQRRRTRSEPASAAHTNHHLKAEVAVVADLEELVGLAGKATRPICDGLSFCIYPFRRDRMPQLQLQTIPISKVDALFVR